MKDSTPSVFWNSQYKHSNSHSIITALMRLAAVCIFSIIQTTQVFAADNGTALDPNLKHATFAGGCFWCMEKPFDELDGVSATISGYSGGHVESPSYAAVSAGTTGHTEVVQITYDPRKISYQKLLSVFWKNIDPTVENRQFCDKGSQYRSAIFFHSAEQEKLARASLLKVTQELKAKGKATEVYTELAPFKAFYPAEAYHQDYYLRNPIRYKYYRYRCGRDARLQQIWGEK